MAEMINTPDDDAFKKFIESQKQKEAEHGSSGGSGGAYQGETVKFCAAPQKGHAIVRFIGAAPRDDGQPSVHPYDAIERHISKIKDDKGKDMYLILPTRKDILSDDHIMWRIISKVKEKEWINKKSVFVNQIDAQGNEREAWKIVSKGGFKPEDGKKYTFASGWDAPKMLLINCIDRLDNWCKENKHTKVFSRNVYISDTGAEFPDWGVKANGFLTRLVENLGKYGSWSKYDSYVIRTGVKDNPWKIINATGMIAANMAAELEGITEAEKKLVSLEPGLTDEEKYYDTYDLEKNFKVSSYNKLLTRLGGQVKAIDADLGTRFFEELTALAAQEKKDREAEVEIKKEIEAKEAASAPAVTETPAAEPTASELRRRAIQEEKPAAAGLSPEKIALLKGWDGLEDSEKALIKDVVVKADGTVDHVVYDDSCGNQYPCPTDQGGCGALSPESFKSCPVCSKRWG